MMKQLLIALIFLSVTAFAFNIKAVTVKNSKGKEYTVEPVTTEKEFNAIPKTMGTDFRISLYDNDRCRSCLSGIDYDPDFTRSQVYTIKNENSIVGVITTHIMPAKQLAKLGCIRKENNTIVFHSQKNALGLLNNNGYSIVQGLFTILDEHKGNDLPTHIQKQFQLPYVNDLIIQAPDGANIVISATQFGKASTATIMEFIQSWKNYLYNNGSNYAPLTSNIAALINKAKNDSLEGQTTELFDLKKIEYYNFSVGALHMKKVR